MTQERIAEAQEDANVSAMTPRPTHPNMEARQYRSETLTQYSAVRWESREVVEPRRWYGVPGPLFVTHKGNGRAALSAAKRDTATQCSTLESQLHTVQTSTPSFFPFSFFFFFSS